MKHAAVEALLLVEAVEESEVLDSDNENASSTERSQRSVLIYDEQKRTVNEMSVKLPFSSIPTQLKSRLLDMQGQLNRSKELSTEKKRLYKQVLESKNKDFKTIIGLSDDEESWKESEDFNKIHVFGERKLEPYADSSQASQHIQVLD